MVCVVFFFFKQKTAYEMRISDWSSDVCSSDLLFEKFTPENVVPAALYLVSEDAPTNMIVGAGAGAFHAAYVTMTPGIALPESERTPEGVAAAWEKIGSASCRDRVCQYG